MLHTMAALSSKLRCASGSGGSSSCPRFWNAPDVFSSSEGVWALSLSMISDDSFISNLRPRDAGCSWRKLDRWDESGMFSVGLRDNHGRHGATHGVLWAAASLQNMFDIGQLTDGLESRGGAE